MAVNVVEIFRRVQDALNDASAVRWPLVELLRYVNDAPEEIAIIAPETLAQTGVITLVAGTLQSLPANAHSLIRTVCNVTGTDPSFVRGRTVTPVKRAVLDRTIPGWQQSATVPYAVDVVHVVEDDQAHRTFMVFPGNNGTGKIEVVVARRPATIATPGSPTDIASYAALSLDVEEQYLPAVADYVISRAYLKDMALPGAAALSQAAYQRFATALGVTIASEARVNTSQQKAQ